MAELTKEYLDKQLKEQTTELKTFVKDFVHEEIDTLAQDIDGKIDNLAQMVANGFKDLQERLDVREDVEKLDKRVAMIERALHVNQ